VACRTVRTGLLKVGLPGAKLGLQDKDPTIAELLKPLGYATAQIGKNHLGDRNEYLPTVHGLNQSSCGGSDPSGVGSTPSMAVEETTTSEPSS
jgi:arylsulfatase A-like enzyme